MPEKVTKVLGPATFVEDIDFRIQELEANPELEELLLLRAFKMQLGNDWREGLVLVREDNLVEYAKAEVFEIYESRPDDWPFTVLNWQDAAEELTWRLKSFEFEGHTYYYKP